MRGDDVELLDLTLEHLRAAFDRFKTFRRSTTYPTGACPRSPKGNAVRAQALAALLRENRNRNLEGDNGPTAQTLVHGRLNNRFNINKLLSFAEQAAARQLADVVEALTLPVACRTAQFELGSRVDGSCNGPHAPRDGFAAVEVRVSAIFRDGIKAISGGRRACAGVYSASVFRNPRSLVRLHNR